MWPVSKLSNFFVQHFLHPVLYQVAENQIKLIHLEEE